MYTDTIIYIIAEWTNNICMIQTYITWHIKMINSWYWYTALSIKRNDVHLPGLYNISVIDWKLVQKKYVYDCDLVQMCTASLKAEKFSQNAYSYLRINVMQSNTQSPFSNKC